MCVCYIQKLTSTFSYIRVEFSLQSRGTSCNAHDLIFDKVLLLLEIVIYLLKSERLASCLFSLACFYLSLRERNE
jgi:hypothetical protein